MWCFSSPGDPEAGSDPNPVPAAAGSSTPSSAASPGGGASPTLPASDQPPPPPETPPAAGGNCTPGAVTPCPCASAEVTSETVMTEPPDRARTRLGVGERVRVTYSLGSATWTVAGDGSLSSTSGETVTYTAPNAGGSVTLTATGGEGCVASITFTIVEPNAVNMIKKFTDPHRVQHTQSFPDIGMATNIFLAPTDVNFHRVQILELEVLCTASGVYSCNNATGHFPGTDGVGATTHVQAGMGTFLSEPDSIYSGGCGVPWVAPTTGAMHWPIPWRWRVGASGAWHVLTTVHQRISADAAGLLTATKAGAKATAMASDPTSTP